MTGVRAYRSYSYTSLRDVVACSIVAASSHQWSSQLSPSQSLSDIRSHVHMRNPLLEKAARAYLATGSGAQRESNSSRMASSFSSFLKIFGVPLYNIFGGASAWFKQLYVRI